MNYEELYLELQPAEKSLKDAASAINRSQRAIQKNTETGNLAEIEKILQTLSDAVKQCTQSMEAISAAVEAFDTQEYFSSGEFSRQMLEACAQKGVDARGEMGVYEMFPYKVRVSGDDEHAAEIYINRKKLPTYRPSYVADTLAAGREKLFRASFNAASFMNELAEAYDTACLKSKGRYGNDLSLDKIYKALAPTARARKDYDKQAYAFDLARVYEKGTDAWITKKGQKYIFGTSRDGKTGIRVLSSSGAESYIATFRPVREEE